jgi:NAD(P)-dependent dehydrogenase (short-subunit alcohol dehydrogenase family)
MAPYTLPADAVWFITGCSSGIGYALANYLLTSTSSRVVATARNPDTLTSLPQTPNLLALPLDVTSEASVKSAVAATLDHWSRIDVLVNNAGYNILAPAELTPLSAAQGVMDTNFWGAVRLTRLVLPIMREQNAREGQRGGVVLQISSMGGRRGFAGNAVYHASKFALEGWTEAVSKEVEGDWNVHFCCVEPGGVKTNFASRSIATSNLSQGQVASNESTDEKRAAEKAYSNPQSQLNMLKAMHENPEVMTKWADADKVAEAMHRVVGGGDVPLRLPLGADSWEMQRMGLMGELEALEGLKEVAVSVSKDPEGQLKSLEGLRV